MSLDVSSVADATPQRATVAIPALVLDIVEAGQVLRVSRSKVYELAAAGEIQSVKIGRRHLITFASVSEFVDRLADQAST